MGHLVQCKILHGQSLYIFVGMVGYCLENWGDAHFKVVDVNISVEEKNAGIYKYTKYGVVGMKNCIVLIGTSVIDSAYAWSRHRLSKHIGSSFLYILKHMLQ
jgi:hypothetical protein